MVQTPRTIADDMCRAEKEGDRKSLERYLHQDLVFRRADGSIVGKEAFLADLKPRERLDWELMSDEPDAADARSESVALTLIVRTSAGSFRNMRVFVQDDGGWRCRLWVNTELETPLPLQVEMLHHISLPVRDLETSKRFYGEVLGLRESKVPRPAFGFPGAWYQAGASQLHLIVRAPGGTAEDADRPPPTYRTDKGIDSRDVHFALRVNSFSGALEHLKGRGYGEDAKGNHQIQVNRPSRRPGAGFPQIYILDPDGHVIEINAQSEVS